jgi:hypothetical protein
MKQALYIVLITIIIVLGYLKYQARNESILVPPLEPSPSPVVIISPTPEPSIEASPSVSVKASPSVSPGTVIIINPAGAQ